MKNNLKQLISYDDQYERKIIEYFGEENIGLDSTVSPKNDISPLFLCFTNRSGSNALGEDIGFLDGCHFFGEILNYDVVIKRSIENDYKNFSEYLDSLFGNINFKIPIIKASFSQLAFLYSHGYFQYYFGNSKFIHIERGDLLEQAISLFIADHTRQWAAFQEAVDKPPKLAIRRVVKIMDSLSIQNSKFKTFFSLTKAICMNVKYDQYTAQRLKVLEKIAKFLGLNSVTDNLPDKKLIKQILVEKTNYKRTIIRRFKF